MKTRVLTALRGMGRRIPRSRRFLALGGAVCLVVVVGVGGALAVTMTRSSAGPSPSILVSIAPTPSPTEEPTPEPTATPVPYLEATTSGVLINPVHGELATREPIVVMIDDQIKARPQSGLSEADIVWQAPAEGGVPRYMAVFQTRDPDEIGPIRSTRLYFDIWAEEYRAIFVHCGGASPALQYLKTIDRNLVFNADSIRWSQHHYMWRVTWRRSPHNLYTSGPRIRDLAIRLGANKPMTQPIFTFRDDAPAAELPAGGTIKIPYYANDISYKYDPATNTYVRSVTGQSPQTDKGTGWVIAPKNVVILYQNIAYSDTPGSSDARKGRLFFNQVGKGKAMVFNNGQAITAQWIKKSHDKPTQLFYADGPNAGQPIPMVRGQIFMQVVQTDMKATWTVGS